MATQSPDNPQADRLHRVTTNNRINLLNEVEHKPDPMYPNVNEVTGDLIQMAVDGAFDVIAHGCNCFHTMQAGIALALAERFPEIRATDRQTLYGDKRKLGTYSETRLYPNQSANLLTILNCYTQYRYGRLQTGEPSCSYPAIQEVMRIINANFKGQHLGIPRIGAGLAGGKWSIIRQLVVASTPDLKVTIVHYNK